MNTARWITAAVIAVPGIAALLVGGVFVAIAVFLGRICKLVIPE